jgi:quercetin dioxygenase-like cupin family protein
MTRSARFIAGTAAIALIASACGGAAPAASITSSPTPTIAATAAPTATRQVVAATAQGATSAKLTENKVVLTDGVAPDIAAGNYLSTVSLVTLEKGGRTVAHKHGGIESIYVVQGTIEFRMAGGASVILSRGQGAAAPPGTTVQAINGGDATAKFLAFFMTAETAPFQTNVDAAP